MHHRELASDEIAVRRIIYTYTWISRTSWRDERLPDVGHAHRIIIKFCGNAELRI